MHRSRKLTKAYRAKLGKTLPKVMVENCPFCNEGVMKILHSGKTMLVIQNIFPYQYWEFMDVLDHLMVVPKRHVSSLSHLTKEERLEAMELYAEYEGLGYNIYARTDDNTIKSISHQHTHLIRTKNKMAKAGLFSRKPYFVVKI